MHLRTLEGTGRLFDVWRIPGRFTKNLLGDPLIEAVHRVRWWRSGCKSGTVQAWSRAPR